MLKPYNEDEFIRYLKLLPHLKIADGSEDYEVAKILAKRKKNVKIMYPVKGKGYLGH